MQRPVTEYRGIPETPPGLMLAEAKSFITDQFVFLAKQLPKIVATFDELDLASTRARVGFFQMYEALSGETVMRQDKNDILTIENKLKVYAPGVLEGGQLDQTHSEGSRWRTLAVNKLSSEQFSALKLRIADLRSHLETDVALLPQVDRAIESEPAMPSFEETPNIETPAQFQLNECLAEMLEIIHFKNLLTSLKDTVDKVTATKLSIPSQVRFANGEYPLPRIDSDTLHRKMETYWEKMLPTYDALLPPDPMSPARVPKPEFILDFTYGDSAPIHGFASREPARTANILKTSNAWRATFTAERNTIRSSVEAIAAPLLDRIENHIVVSLFSVLTLQTSETSLQGFDIDPFQAFRYLEASVHSEEVSDALSRYSFLKKSADLLFPSASDSTESRIKKIRTERWRDYGSIAFLCAQLQRLVDSGKVLTDSEPPVSAEVISAPIQKTLELLPHEILEDMQRNQSYRALHRFIPELLSSALPFEQHWNKYPSPFIDQRFSAFFSHPTIKAFLTPPEKVVEFKLGGSLRKSLVDAAAQFAPSVRNDADQYSVERQGSNFQLNIVNQFRSIPPLPIPTPFYRSEQVAPLLSLIGLINGIRTHHTKTSRSRSDSIFNGSEFTSSSGEGAIVYADPLDPEDWMERLHELFGDDTANSGQAS